MAKSGGRFPVVGIPVLGINFSVFNTDPFISIAVSSLSDLIPSLGGFQREPMATAIGNSSLGTVVVAIATVMITAQGSNQ